MKRERDRAEQSEQGRDGERRKRVGKPGGGGPTGAPGGPGAPPHANYNPSGLLTLSYENYKEPDSKCLGSYRLYKFDGDDIQDTLLLSGKTSFVVGAEPEDEQEPTAEPTPKVDVHATGASTHHCILQSKTTDGGPRLWLVAFDACWVNSRRVAPGSQVLLADKDTLQFSAGGSEFLLVEG